MNARVFMNDCLESAEMMRHNHPAPSMEANWGTAAPRWIITHPFNMRKTYGFLSDSNQIKIPLHRRGYQALPDGVVYFIFYRRHVGNSFGNFSNAHAIHCNCISHFLSLLFLSSRALHGLSNERL